MRLALRTFSSEPDVGSLGAEIGVIDLDVPAVKALLALMDRVQALSTAIPGLEHLTISDRRMRYFGVPYNGVVEADDDIAGRVWEEEVVALEHETVIASPEQDTDADLMHVSAEEVWWTASPRKTTIDVTTARVSWERLEELAQGGEGSALAETTAA